VSHDVSDFQTQVIERSRQVPVLVDFWAEWCGPCRVLGPILERLAGEARGRWELAKLDTEAHPEVAARYSIASIPNVKLLVNGEVVDEFVGVLPESRIRAWLERALPSPRAAQVAEARAAIERGDYEHAAVLLQPIVESEPDNHEARLALAVALLHLNPAAVASVTGPLADHPELGDHAEALNTLAQAVLAAARPGELPDDPLRERFVTAAEAVSRGDWAAAVEGFIEVMRAQRDWGDGLAKSAARAAFIHLGFDHPVVERFHRAFSGALHV
jgi:putative thioredoxin